MSIETRLAELGITLPDAPAPAANYVPFVKLGNLVHVSGQISQNEAGLIKGKLGADLSIEQGYQSARLMAINHLALMKAALGGDLDRVRRIVKMVGYVSCAPGFEEPHLVMNGASDLYVELFGPEAGKHARAALTQHQLGLDAPVEAELTVQLFG